MRKTVEKIDGLYSFESWYYLYDFMKVLYAAAEAEFPGMTAVDKCL